MMMMIMTIKIIIIIIIMKMMMMMMMMIIIIMIMIIINNFVIESDFNGPIWFKLGTMIDATKLHILTLVCVTLTLIQGHGDARKQKLLC